MIYVVTWYGCNDGGFNYGTALQSFALQQAIGNLGYDVVLLRYLLDGRYSWWKKLLIILGIWGLARSTLHRLMGKRRFSANAEQKLKRWHKQHYNEKVVRFPWQLSSLCKNAECFVSGSDQIWNTYNFFSEFMFLSFVKNCRKVSYASSIGTSGFEPSTISKVKDLLDRYDVISVREESAVKAISELTEREDVLKVLDPTFLLNDEEWLRLADTPDTHMPDDFVLCYFISANETYGEQLTKVKSKLGVKNVVVIPSLENPNFSFPGAITVKSATPSEFIYLISKAKIVCTDSYHATALSINLQKKFVEFLRFKDSDIRSQNTRIYDLLDHYKLRWCLYDELSDAWSNTIDYVNVRSILQQDKIESHAILERSLKGENI